MYTYNTGKNQAAVLNFNYLITSIPQNQFNAFSLSMIIFLVSKLDNKEFYIERTDPILEQ